VTYEPFGPVKGWSWGNGTAHSRAYDQDGRVTAISTSLASGVNLGYDYDDASRITGISDSGVNPTSWTYGYDLLDRLSTAQGPSQTQGFTYDANGNRLSQTGTQASTFTVSATSNRLSSASGTLNRSYAYDAAGNALTYENVTLTYNHRNRLKSTKKGTTTRSYVYNALGQMVKASGGTGGTVLYAYDESGHLLGQYTAAGALTQETIWLGDIPVATLRTNSGGVGVFYVHADHLNTPIKLTRPSDNAMVWRWDHDPFGNGAPDLDPDGNGQAVSYDLRFPGQIYDAQAGMHQNYFRDYSPAIGRYVESDPIGLEGGVNTYVYVEGNPVSYTDPTGELVPQLIGFGIGAALEYLTNPCASTTDILIAGGLGAFGGGLSKAAFLRLGPRSLTRETGLEWSHSIARRTVNSNTTGGLNRVLNQRGGLNGSWRSPASHARHDATRHVAGVDPMPLPLRALDRIPDWLKATGLGGGAGAGIAGDACECRR
jgi:RHS repeat-associated protein